jgi:predicted deacetylase
MNWEMWKQIEQVMLEQAISPILAVVPENLDKKLEVGPAHPSFWKEVRGWQARGWTIGLHGYQHKYVTRDGGLVGIVKKSEFAGLPEQQQEHKLRLAIEIFERHQVKPEIWIAPSHSFDSATLSALHRLGIRIISDGFALSPHTDATGMFWIPQQFWRFRSRRFGVWTVCYHHNHWKTVDLQRFARDVRKYRDNITNTKVILATYSQRRSRVIDQMHGKMHRIVLLARQRFRSVT